MFGVRLAGKISSSSRMVSTVLVVPDQFCEKFSSVSGVWVCCSIYLLCLSVSVSVSVSVCRWLWLCLLSRVPIASLPRGGHVLPLLVNFQTTGLVVLDMLMLDIRSLVSPCSVRSWYNDAPKNWRRNTAIAVGFVVLSTAAMFQYSANREVYAFCDECS
jgi:hypothetical protein